MKASFFFITLILIGFASAALANGSEEELYRLSEYASPIILAQGADENGEWEDYTYLSETNFSVEIDQNVQGTGFHSSYKYASMPDLAGNVNEVAGSAFSGMVVQNRSYGSGAMDKQFKLSGYSFFTEAGWNAKSEEGGIEKLELDDDAEESLPLIQIKEESDIQYYPVAMSIGIGHYRGHPINFNSMLRESTCIKNLDTGSLIQNDIDHARALHKNLEASADFLGLEGFDPYTGHYFKGGGNTIMNLEEMVTDGRVHIGALKLIDVPDFQEAEEEEEEGEMPIIFRKPIPEIEMDEVYQGTFQIKKNMRFNYFTDDDDVEDEWLPCCSGGWNTMSQLYQAAVGKDDKEIFDCICYKPPVVAQFPRAY